MKVSAKHQCLSEYSNPDQQLNEHAHCVVWSGGKFWDESKFYAPNMLPQLKTNRKIELFVEI